MTTAELKSEVNSQVECQREELIELSLRIHANPELGFKEEKALNWITSYLAGKGFQIEKGIGSLPTAFKSVYGNGEPVIALLAEYDALPEVGHACGHNIIAAAAVGAGVACKSIIDNCGGTITIFGTPAEELFGGKVIMLQEGLFDGVDVAMMVHAGTRNRATIQALACVGLEIEFFGKAAHAAAHPEEGVNALETMILAFNAINSLRQHIKDNSRVHGIITHGGEAANVVPAYSAAKLLVRASNSVYLEELKQKVLNCFSGASLATGAQLEYKWGEIVYAPMNNNLTLARLFSLNLESLGRKVKPLDDRSGFGSTDMGNISQIMPAIHPSVAIAEPGISLHSTDFALAAASEAGHQGLLDAAKALAMTVADVLSEPGVLDNVKEEFFRRS